MKEAEGESGAGPEAIRKDVLGPCDQRKDNATLLPRQWLKADSFPGEDVGAEAISRSRETATHTQDTVSSAGVWGGSQAGPEDVTQRPRAGSGETDLPSLLGAHPAAELLFS